MGKRTYRLEKRARDQQETRRRIVEATVELHREVGPAATTVSAIADRAGVQRLTVYRHFPGDHDLLRACSARVAADNPAPDPAEWAGISDPRARLETALTAVYRFYRSGEATLSHVLRDAERMPQLAEVMAPMGAYLEAVEGMLLEPWEAASERNDGGERRLRTAVRHALSFDTWRSFKGQGLLDAETVELMCRFVAAAR
ncbi:MAG: helix-turn-helix domain-containing protein [Trueperaceae bacterium]